VSVHGSLSSCLEGRGGRPSDEVLLGASGGRDTLASSQRARVDGERLFSSLGCTQGRYRPPSIRRGVGVDREVSLAKLILSTTLGAGYL
jgi:hypothetical protein